jgi:hypothetical protein
MPKKPYQGARLRYTKPNTLTKNKSNKDTCTPLVYFKRFAATISSVLFVGTLGYDGYMRREVEININNPMTLITRLSNPCSSENRLRIVIDKLKNYGMDDGNTSLVPDTFIYASDSELKDLGVFVNQLQITAENYGLQCKTLSDIAPELKNDEGETEKEKENSFVNAFKKYPKLGETVQTADFSTTSSELDRKLQNPANNEPTTPDDIHLMPHLRWIIGTRYLTALILFFIYFFDIIKLLNKLKLNKLVLTILNNAAPWKLK